MEMQNTGTCRSCRFFEDWGRDDAIFEGQCRRNAPMAKLMLRPEMTATNFDGEDLVAVWPMVSDSDWCGEHQPRPIVP